MIAEDLPALVNANEAYQNTKKNSDKQNAQVGHGKVLMAAIVPILRWCTTLDLAYAYINENYSFPTFVILGDPGFGSRMDPNVQARPPGEIAVTELASS